MPIELVTLDCAQTLLEVDWSLPRMVTLAGDSLGWTVQAEDADRFEGLFRANIREYFSINLAKDIEAQRRFFVRLSREWLPSIEVSPDQAEPLVATSEAMLHRPDGPFYRLYPDVRPALAELREAGIRLAVLSNWDQSLARALKTFELFDEFDLVVASLEEGVEKPEKALFDICLSRLNAKPGTTLHVGDDPIDDLQGGRDAGLHAALIDRSQPREFPHRIASLGDIKELIAWIG